MVKYEYNCSVYKEYGTDFIAIDRNLDTSENVPQGLKISFKRTIRVPDNGKVNQLPPGLGSFALHKIHDYAERLPREVVQKGGVFLSMYQKEAMWIRFESTAPFLIKIYVGGVNAISGEHAAEEDADGVKQRRADLEQSGHSIQDYVVVPGQEWIDGVAVKAGLVRQFVAMPMGDGYSVEAQLTGKETVGGLQLEITPLAAKGESQPGGTILCDTTWLMMLDHLQSNQSHARFTKRGRYLPHLPHLPHSTSTSELLPGRPFQFSVLRTTTSTV